MKCEIVFVLLFAFSDSTSISNHDIQVACDREFCASPSHDPFSLVVKWHFVDAFKRNLILNKNTIVHVNDTTISSYTFVNLKPNTLYDIVMNVEFNTHIKIRLD